MLRFSGNNCFFVIPFCGTIEVGCLVLFTEECFEEMQKHQPSGWIKRGGYYYNIIAIGVISVTIIGTEGNIARLNYSDLLNHYNFIDGTLVGIKKEE